MNGNIEFGDEQQASNPRFLYSRLQVSAEKPGVVNFLINHKIVKSENGANVFLISLTLLFLATSVLFFMYGSGFFDGKKKDGQSIVDIYYNTR
jgi:hypothetical protein